MNVVDTSTKATKRHKVLIVEDDRDLNNLLRFTFEASGDYEVNSHFEATGAVERVLETQPDLVILDVMLPGDGSGKDVLKRLRSQAQTQELPVILLTAKGQEQDRVDGFESGADDYITKPFSPKELLLRVQAILRRSGAGGRASQSGANDTEEPVIQVGPIKVYTEVYRVCLNDVPVSLTSTEYQLLLYLAERVGRLQSRGALLQKVWGYDGNLNTRTVDTHVKRLRQKLGAHGNMIETVHGFGYQLVEKVSASAGTTASARKESSPSLNV